MSTSPTERRLRHFDYALLGIFCLIVFGYSLLDSRVLTAHEAVQPENVREMLIDHDWIVPKFGGLPWLERPPLPHWIMAGIATIAGRCDREWIVRIGPVLMATITVLLIGWMGALWYGRTIGLTSGLILATMYEFVTFASDPEADMFLCPIVTGAIALFVYLEFGDGRTGSKPALPGPADQGDTSLQPVRAGFFGGRPWAMLAFFVVLGMTNLAKGLVFGNLMALVAIAGFLIWNWDWKAIRRYVWLWGWLAYAAVALAWPLAAYRRYPDIIPLWLSDYMGRLNGGYIGEPAWYYLAALPWVILPWTIPALVGIGLTATKAWQQRCSPERFLWCWALLTPATFSIPNGKHHHYLLQCMAPWAILGALGAVWIWERARKREWRMEDERKLRPQCSILYLPSSIFHPLSSVLTLGLAGDLALAAFRSKIPGPEWIFPVLLIGWPALVAGFSWAIHQRNGRVALRGVFGLLAVIYCGTYSYQTHFLNPYDDDTAFLRQVNDVVVPGQPFYVNRDTQPLDGFRTLFYLRDGAVLLQNLTFLLDERIEHEEVYLVTRYQDVERLSRYGAPEVLLQSKHTRAEHSIGDRWTLFRLRFRHDLIRKPGDIRISPMQVTGRQEGPFLH